MSASEPSRRFLPVKIAILTVSDSRGIEDDKSGRVLEDLLGADNHVLARREIVRDDIETIVAIGKVG